MIELPLIEQLAKEYAGNHRKFESFGWHDRPDDDQNWTIVYTNNRDSTLLGQSNAEAIRAILEPYLDADNPDIFAERHGHWACGRVDGYSIRVYRNGEITDAFRAWVDIQDRLENYPVLDEMDYSNREYESTLENLTSEGYDSDLFEAPTEWEQEVYGWLWDHTNTLENVDDRGGYAQREDIHRAMDALGWRIIYTIHWIDCGPMSEYYADEWEALERCKELKGLGFYPRLTSGIEGTE